MCGECILGTKDGVGMRMCVVGSVGRGLFILCFLYSFFLSYNSFLVFSPNPLFLLPPPLSSLHPLPWAVAGRGAQTNECLTAGQLAGHVMSPLSSSGTSLIWATQARPWPVMLDQLGFKFQLFHLLCDLRLVV